MLAPHHPLQLKKQFRRGHRRSGSLPSPSASVLEDQVEGSLLLRDTSLDRQSRSARVSLSTLLGIMRRFRLLKLRATKQGEPEQSGTVRSGAREVALADEAPQDALGNESIYGEASKQIVLRTQAPAKSTSSEPVIDERSASSTSERPKKSETGILLDDLGSKAEKDLLETVEEGIMTYVEGIPTLMSILDAVAQLHPFAAVVVLAFKTAYSLHETHKANTKKVALLQFQIGAMMEVIADLAEVDPKTCKVEVGTRVNDRLAKLAEAAAEDIKKCASALDTYVKKHVAVKVLRCREWNDNLFKYMTIFKERRLEIQDALQMYTGLSILKTHQLLAETRGDVLRMSEQLASTQKYMLHMLTSQEEKYEKIRQQRQLAPDEAGIEILLSIRPESGFCFERRLTTLNNKGWNGKSKPSDTLRHKYGEVAVLTSPHTSTAEESLDALKQIIRQSPEESILANWKVFEGKFNIKRREFQEEFAKLRADLKNMENNILGAFEEGPHLQIEEKHLRAIWAEMKWRTSVDARQLVHVLVDHCRFEQEPRKITDVPHRMGDQWALKWIHGGNMSPIIEALDEDVSGYISVAEANQFMVSRPEGWSTLRWLAYWAMGWHIGLLDSKRRIEALLARMFALRGEIHPANRRAVDEYLENSWWKITRLTSAVESIDIDDDLRARFQEYYNTEESRLRRNLEEVQYCLDDAATVQLVAGRGRIENNLLTMYCLVLERHFQILCVARAHVLHSDELWSAQNTIEQIWGVVIARFNHLQRVFVDREFVLSDRFTRFAHGLYRGQWDAVHDRLGAVAYEKLPKFALEDNIEDPDVIPEEVLVFSVLDEYSFGEDAYKEVAEPETELDKTAGDTSRPILGVWNIFTAYDEIIYPHRPMISVHIHAGEDPQSFRGRGIDHEGTEFTLSGVCTTFDDKPGVVHARFTLSFASRIKEQICNCTIENAAVSMAGSWRYKGEEKLRDIFCSKLSPEVLCCRPSPNEFRQNKAKTLWRFACDVALDQVRKTTFRWSRLKQRRDRRREFIELYIRHMKVFGPPLKEEMTKLVALTRRITTADAKLYKNIRAYQLRATPIHFGARCDQCKGQIGGSRLICLECPSTAGLVNLCGDTECASADKLIPSPGQPLHLHNHAVLKTNQIIPAHEFAQVLENTRAAFAEQEYAIEELEKENEEIRSKMAEHQKFQQLPRYQRCSIIYEDLKATWRREHEYLNRDQKDVLDKQADEEVKRLDALSFEERTMSCTYCKKAVKIMEPFWSCVDCPWSTCIICVDCERTRRVVPFERQPATARPVCTDEKREDGLNMRRLRDDLAPHDATIHILVKHMGGQKVPPLIPVQERLDQLETRMSDIDTKIARITDICETLQAYLTPGCPPPGQKPPSVAKVALGTKRRG